MGNTKGQGASSALSKFEIIHHERVAVIRSSFEELLKDLDSLGCSMSAASLDMALSVFEEEIAK